MAKKIVQKMISIYEETLDKLKVLKSRSLKDAEMSFNLSKFVRFALNDEGLIKRFIDKIKNRT